MDPRSTAALCLHFTNNLSHQSLTSSYNLIRNILKVGNHTVYTHINIRTKYLKAVHVVHCPSILSANSSYSPFCHVSSSSGSSGSVVRSCMTTCGVGMVTGMGITTGTAPRELCGTASLCSSGARTCVGASCRCLRYCTKLHIFRTMARTFLPMSIPETRMSL